MIQDKDIRWIQRFDNYGKALQKLTQAVNIVTTGNSNTQDIDELLKEGLIQRFELFLDFEKK